MSFYRSDTFRKIFLSYTLILIIPIIVFGGIFIRDTAWNYQENMQKSYEDDAARIRDAVDSRLAELSNIGDRLYQSKWVGKLASDTNVFEKQFDVLKKLEISQDLSNYMAFSGMLSHIAVIFPYKDLVISQNGWYSINGYFDFIPLNDKQEYDSIISNMIGYTYFKIIEGSQSEILKTKNEPTQNINNDKYSIKKDALKYIAVIQSVELHNEPRVSLLLFLDIEYLLSYIKQITGSNLEQLSITNGKTKVFNSSFGELEIDESKKSKKSKKQYIYVTIPSNVTTWEYEYFYGNDNITFNAEQLIPLLLACVLSLTIGFLSAFLLTRLTYKPLYRLFNKVFKQNGIFKTANKKMSSLYEYRFIETSFTELVTEKENMLHRVQNFENAAKWNLLLRLLKGYFEVDNLTEKLAELAINYNNDKSFCVILIDEKSLDAPLKERQKKLDFIIAASEVLDVTGLEYELLEVLDDNIAIIISIGSRNKDETHTIDESYIKKVIENIYFKIESCGKSKSKPVITIGGIEKGIIGISKSYQIAKKNSELAVFGIDILGNPKTVIETGFYYYPTDWEIQLINNLKVGSLETVTRIIDEIKLENINRQISIDLMKRLISLIMETIIRVLNELNINAMLYQKEFNKLISEKPTSEKDMDSIWLYIYKVSKHICERNRHTNEAEDENLGGILMQYVNDNYSDSDLSLKKMSELLCISVSTVSKLFKDISGINFFDYMCRLRMEKAKELLKNNGYDLKKIASAVGYENEYSFKRAFLRYEGIRPSDYLLNVDMRC